VAGEADIDALIRRMQDEVARYAEQADPSDLEAEKFLKQMRFNALVSETTRALDVRLKNVERLLARVLGRLDDEPSPPTD
jgi:hypothetical protein